MKLWLDDVRPAPDDSWQWVKTVEEAKIAFINAEVTIASLDHDLGYIADPNASNDPREPQEIPWFEASSRPGADGIDLAEWMQVNSIFPSEKIIIHSWNPVGAENMRRALENAPVPVIVSPFQLPEGAA